MTDQGDICLFFSAVTLVLPDMYWYHAHVLLLVAHGHCSHLHAQTQPFWPNPGTYHSCSSGEGMSPAESVQEPSTRPCHQLLSSLFMI